MSLPKTFQKVLNSKNMLSQNDSDFSDNFEELDPYLCYCGHLPGDNFQNLSKSDYAKVIFCDLYYNSDNTAGCRFQITDSVHEDPCDYIGLFKVGHDSLSQCLASKLLSETECEEDGKSIRCTFRPCELPELEDGFYQFLYITREKEVCGKSMPFSILSSIKKSLSSNDSANKGSSLNDSANKGSSSNDSVNKDSSSNDSDHKDSSSEDPTIKGSDDLIIKNLSSDEDFVADVIEDDFLVVRSSMAEKNRCLQSLLERTKKYESEMKKFQEKLKIASEEKNKIEGLLHQACEEKLSLLNETQKVKEEKNIMCQEKEEAIRILKEKNKVFSSMFDDYSEKLKEFTDLKDELLEDKNRVIVENVKLQEHIKNLTEKMENRRIMFDIEREKKENLTSSLKKESLKLQSQLDDAKLMIEALEKSKQLSVDEITSLTEDIAKLVEQLRDLKCKNLVLETKLSESANQLEKNEKEMQRMKSEITGLKLHILELHEVELQSAGLPSPAFRSFGIQSSTSKSSSKSDTSVEERKESTNLKKKCAELEAELQAKNETISELKEELVKVHGVVEYLKKEKNSVQQNGSLLQDALNECILRLNEGSELYKKQFRKIEKLKKKLKNQRTQLMDNTDTISMQVSCSSTADSTDKAENVAKLPQNQNSDSDTGELVLRNPSHSERKVFELREVLESADLAPFLEALIPEFEKHEDESPVGAVGKSPSPVIMKEVPELQTLIEMNLEKFKNSQTKEDEIQYSVPCPVCDQDIGVYMSSTDEMVKHLEMQHKQTICPVCGRLFDMNLPPKYFYFHVEDHFMKEKK